MIVSAYMVDAFKLDLTTGNSGTGLRCYIVNNDIFAVCGDDECLDYYPVYRFNDGRFSIFDGVISSIRPATKQEILDIGLWNFVINKEDFLNIEDELDEYLRIGEELSKQKEEGK